ncbi:MAG TPA: 8-amino-7-oxononanoate synthase [Acidimicrobiia bacterium]|nr:8-amino-7-oxononanoate synthase [Acidimicrobiia bacterium]
MTWGEWVDGELATIRRAGQWRAPRTLDAAGPEGKLGADGRPVVSFASNDYLGLTQHPEVIAAAHAALDRWGAGSGAARLIVGSRPVHDELEAELATGKGTERAVVFPTGFAANLGALTTFGGPDVLVCSDELNHASIIDGARLSGSEIAIFRHADVDHLASLVDRADGRRCLVVSDSVFSMDGDVAPITDLVALCSDRGCLLVLDEAHAVLGPDPDLRDIAALRVGTLSKTHGALGGFIACDRQAADLLVNRARSYIFTTAPTPADSGAALAAARILAGPEGAALRSRLRANIDQLRPGHPSPIVSVPCGAEADAVSAADALLARGLLVPAIRPPTVAPGTSRLRVTLSAAHTPGQVERLVEALRGLGLLAAGGS